MEGSPDCLAILFFARGTAPWAVVAKKIEAGEAWKWAFEGFCVNYGRNMGKGMIIGSFLGTGWILGEWRGREWELALLGAGFSLFGQYFYTALVQKLRRKAKSTLEIMQCCVASTVSTWLPWTRYSSYQPVALKRFLLIMEIQFWLNYKQLLKWS